MSVLNTRMLLKCLNILSKGKVLSSEMSDILSQWFVEVEGSYFFKILYEKQKGHLDKSNFIDKTGFECFVNSFHVDDYTSKEFLEQSLLFAQLVFEKWLITNKELILKCIISETNTGVNIRFHIQRTNENWILDNDLENFEEGVFIMTSK